MVQLEPLILGLVEFRVRTKDSGLCEHLIAITSLRNLNEEMKHEFNLGDSILANDEFANMSGSLTGKNHLTRDTYHSKYP